MARTYLSTLSPRRRWGIAGGAGGVALLLTAGLGNPWTAGTIGGLGGKPGGDSVPLLANTLAVFHWTLGPRRLDLPANQQIGQWTAVLVLDLGWPLLILLGARILAGGLAPRRARISAVLGVWSVTTLTGAASGALVGLLDHTLAHGASLPGLPTTGSGHLGDLLTAQAAALAMLGAALGWLPGLAAVIAYSVNRGAVAPATAGTGEENTLVDPRTTLDLAGLESIRRARRPDDFNNTLPDVHNSNFFADN
jgi:hypothetical protein